MPLFSREGLTFLSQTFQMERYHAADVGKCFMFVGSVICDSEGWHFSDY